MRSDKTQALGSMSTRQKVMAIAMVVVIIIIMWQLKDLFGIGGGSKSAPKPASVSGSSSATSPSGPSPNVTPKVVDVSENPPTTQHEAELMKLQQETEAKYIQALNALQILKVQKEIANTDKDISSAQLAKVVSQKKIVDLLAPPPPPPPSESMNKQVFLQQQQQTFATNGLDMEAKYTVLSVSHIQNIWNAVLNYKGSLFNVRVGDVLPPDGSKVTFIGRDGVTIERDGNKRKIAIVSAI